MPDLAGVDVHPGGSPVLGALNPLHRRGRQGRHQIIGGDGLGDGLGGGGLGKRLLRMHRGRLIDYPRGYHVMHHKG